MLTLSRRYLSIILEYLLKLHEKDAANSYLQQQILIEMICRAFKSLLQRQWRKNFQNSKLKHPSEALKTFFHLFSFLVDLKPSNETCYRYEAEEETSAKGYPIYFERETATEFLEEDDFQFTTRTKFLEWLARELAVKFKIRLKNSLLVDYIPSLSKKIFQRLKSLLNIEVAGLEPEVFSDEQTFLKSSRISCRVKSHLFRKSTETHELFLDDSISGLTKEHTDLLEILEIQTKNLYSDSHPSLMPFLEDAILCSTLLICQQDILIDKEYYKLNFYLKTVIKFFDRSVEIGKTLSYPVFVTKKLFQKALLFCSIYEKTVSTIAHLKEHRPAACWSYVYYNSDLEAYRSLGGIALSEALDYFRSNPLKESKIWVARALFMFAKLAQSEKSFCCALLKNALELFQSIYNTFVSSNFEQNFQANSLIFSFSNGT